MSMRRRLGDTDVAAIGLGAMPLSLDGGPDMGTAIAVIRCFIDSGGDFIDTANAYSAGEEPGENERLIARALAGLPERRAIRVATKGGVLRNGEGWRVDARPAALQLACDQSLRDLNAEQIYLYQLHAPDPAVDIRESVAALERLRETGKIVHIGLSNVDLEQLEAARTVAPVMSVQNRLNPRRKKHMHNGVLQRCRQLDISFIAHSPVGGHHHYRQLANDPELKKLAARYATTPASLSIAWLLQLAENIIVIAGARRRQSVLASRAAMDLHLDAGEIAAISALEDW